MTLQLDLPPERIAALRDGIARHDAEAIGRILLASPVPLIEVISDESDERDYLAEPLTIEEYDREVADMDAEFATIFGSAVPELPDYAISREGIYGDHP